MVSGTSCYGLSLKLLASGGIMDIHKSVGNAVHYKNLCLGSTLLKGGPLELLQHNCDAAGRSII